MPWEFVDGRWDTTRMTDDERAYERQRWNENVLMWTNEWMNDSRAIKLDIKGHPYFYVRRTRHDPSGRAYARFNTRAAGTNTPEAWIVAHGTGIVRMSEEAVIVGVVTDEEKALQGYVKPYGPPHRGDAVVTHYWFEDAPTGMMFKMLWC